jgi:hypothetical protein
MHSWIRAMSADTCVGNQAVLLNISYDLENSYPETHQVLCEFLQALEQRWSEDHQPDADAFSFFCKVAREGDSNKYLCKGPQVRENFQECSRVVGVRSFLEKNLNLRELGWWISEFGENLEDWQVEILEEPDVSEKIGRGEIRGRRPIAWVTQTEALRTIYQEFSSRGAQASAIRNRLGLIGYRTGKELIEIRYSKATLVQSQLRRPVVLDGCTDEYYQHTPIYRSLKAQDGWGKTSDLENYEEGLPEAVHSPIQFGAGFTLKYVGYACPLDERYDEQYFLESLPFRYRYSLEDIVKLVESISRDAEGEQ